MLKRWRVQYVTVTGETLVEEMVSYTAGWASDEIKGRKGVSRVKATTFVDYVS